MADRFVVASSLRMESSSQRSRMAAEQHWVPDELLRELDWSAQVEPSGYFEDILEVEEPLDAYQRLRSDLAPPEFAACEFEEAR